MTADAPAIEIRRAGRTDAAAWRRAVEILLPDTRPPESETGAALASDGCYAYLALAGDAPVGLLGADRLPGLTTRGPLVYFYDIAVARRTGEVYAEYEWRFEH